MNNDTPKIVDVSEMSTKDLKSELDLYNKAVSEGFEGTVTEIPEKLNKKELVETITAIRNAHGVATEVDDAVVFTPLPLVPGFSDGAVEDADTLTDNKQVSLYFEGNLVTSSETVLRGGKTYHEIKTSAGTTHVLSHDEFNSLVIRK